MIITELRVNHVTEPKGYCYEPVSFSWKVEEEKEAKKQKYARITVKKGEEIVFDSGDDKDADSLDYPVRFHMESRCRYDWTVCVTADNGETAEASSFFETGKLQEAWKAQWITPGEALAETDAMAGYILEKEFQVPEKSEDARLYICGL
ncbi:MAG: alpha-L-rhamnosidase, partial [Lachnospiraceae bacterium]|nr:alpha-L-rhamnosidase [Lachnospiraceae bacterium]